ncbi:hypothetical protein M9458_036059, partial [Cirrhinus mrigala]
VFLSKDCLSPFFSLSFRPHNFTAVGGNADCYKQCDLTTAFLSFGFPVQQRD